MCSVAGKRVSPAIKKNRPFAGLFQVNQRNQTAPPFSFPITSPSRSTSLGVTIAIPPAGYLGSMASPLTVKANAFLSATSKGTGSLRCFESFTRRSIAETSSSMSSHCRTGMNLKPLAAGTMSGSTASATIPDLRLVVCPSLPSRRADSSNKSTRAINGPPGLDSGSLSSVLKYCGDIFN